MFGIFKHKIHSDLIFCLYRFLRVTHSHAREGAKAESREKENEMFTTVIANQNRKDAKRSDFATLPCAYEGFVYEGTERRRVHLDERGRSQIPSRTDKNKKPVKELRKENPDGLF